MRGEILPRDEWAVAVVGTRNPSHYGKEVVDQIAGDLAGNGITVISGLALGRVIVEAGERSGALITADYTLEQGRELFAVPGKIVARKSRGTNRLIQEGGAKLILSVEDILWRS